MKLMSGLRVCGGGGMRPLSGLRVPGDGSARGAGRRAMAGGAALVAMVAVMVAMAGCGGVLSPDLFIVYRSGSTPGAKLTLLVNEEGVVHCNGGAPYRLSDPQVIEARTIQEDLEKPASEHKSLPASRGSVLAYYVRDENGSVRFADNSPGQPEVTRKLAAFVLRVAQDLCHLPQQGA